MSDPRRGRTVELFRDNFAAAHAGAERLARSLERLAPQFPIGADQVAQLDLEQEDALDALLHRFTNLLALIQDRLFRGVALLEQEVLAGRSKRDLCNLMERFGVVPSAERFSTIAELRNKLAHDYPNDPAKQAERLNDAYNAASELLRILDRIREHVTAKRLADLGAFGPVASPPLSRRPSA
ncbi:MAG TPA: hypothetical protein VFG47_03090 [Geminicoccaceae bacterium]|nr:hypothetical protein [Geminicoccaceae bacterium]